MALLRAVGDIGVHDHTCLLYGDDDERWSVVARYVEDGLDAGERVVVVPFAESPADVVQALDRTGVRCVRPFEDGQLTIEPGDLYVAGGFDPVRVTRRWGELVRDSATAGYEGLRVVGDMGWAAGAVDSAMLVAYEEGINPLFRPMRVAGLCLYDERRFDDRLLHGIVRAHPNVMCSGPHHHRQRVPVTEELRVELGDGGAVRLDGTADRATAPRLADALRLAAMAASDVDVDVAHLGFMDVSGLRELWFTARRLTQQGRTVSVHGASPLLRRLVRLLEDAHADEAGGSLRLVPAESPP